MNIQGVTATHPASACTTPAYDGSGQAMHPDVIDFGAGNTWNGYRYWMCETPYTDTSEAKENPSILASSDGDTWVVPNGLTNPVVPAPGGNLVNTDPDLVYNPDEGKLYLLYRVWNKDTGNVTLYVKESTDGVTWSGATTTGITVSADDLTSPFVVWTGTQYRMYHIGGAPDLSVRTSSSMTGTWSAAVACTRTGGPAGMWHVGGTRLSDGSYAFIGSNGAGTGIYLGYCEGGLNFYWQTDPLLSLEGTGWDKDQLYRAALVRTASGFDIWYSARSGTAWHIGKTAATIAADEITPGTVFKDALLRQNMATTNYGAETYVSIGNYAADNIRTSVIKPDLTGIPAGATILTASLAMTVYAVDNQAPGSHTIKLHRCLRDWNEDEANWNEYASGASWNTAGCRGSGTDYTATELGSKTLQQTDTGRQTFTLDAAEFQNLLTTNYGVYLTSTVGVTGPIHHFYSSDYATEADRPVFTITYQAGSTKRAVYFSRQRRT